MKMKTLFFFYNQKVEDLATRLLYFFNTLDTYVLVAGIGGALLITTGKLTDYPMAIVQLLGFLFWFRVSDFHPFFILYSFPATVFLAHVAGLQPVSDSLLVNACIFFVVQILFMGIPDSIVGRSPRIILYKIHHSMFTLSPTTVSFPVSIYFSSFLTMGIIATNQLTFPKFVLLHAFLAIAAFFAKIQRAKNKIPAFEKYPTNKRLADRVILLNIDGCRLDVFNSLTLPNIERIKQSGTTCDNGLTTVYRALTNPAFASILTGAFPEEHGVVNNNFGQSIKTEALPDKVKTKLYGSMHVKHFSKKHWDTTIISLPTTSIYGCDEEMVAKFKVDFLTSPETRLFVLDFSEADFLGHAYGSTSEAYKQALSRIDQKIGHIADWLETKKLISGTSIIICSDHGMKAIDHSYLLFQEEKYVPFIVMGPHVKAGHHFSKPDGSIVDICANMAYMLGVEYPKNCHGRVFLEMFEGIDAKKEREIQISLFNRIIYDKVAKTYDEKHPEITEADETWWRKVLETHLDKDRVFSVLDFGCGTGFVGNIFRKTGRKFDKFVCFDISKKALTVAREKLKNDERFIFLSDFEEIIRRGFRFDIITINSVLHHLYNPTEAVARLKGLLNSNGYIIGAHEPNRNYFKAPTKKMLGELYKRFGYGVEFAGDDIFPAITEELKEHGYTFFISPQQVQQLVEFHSPVEQDRVMIDTSKGFDPDSFFNVFFDGYHILEKRLYTTALNRKGLRLPKSVQKAITTALFGKNGNLISYVVRNGNAAPKVTLRTHLLPGKDNINAGRNRELPQASK